MKCPRVMRLLACFIRLTHGLQELKDISKPLPPNGAVERLLKFTGRTKSAVRLRDKSWKTLHYAEQYAENFSLKCTRVFNMKTNMRIETNWRLEADRLAALFAVQQLSGRLFALSASSTTNKRPLLL